jgi:hypothetical protein
MAIAISTSARDGACNAIVDLIDAGSGAGTLAIRTGAAPATPATADSGTLLATLTMSDPAFGNSSTGTATASAITSDTNVDNSGTAAHFRIKDSDANVIIQGTVGTSGADINFNSVTFVAGGTAAISSLTVTVPAS